MADRRPIPRGLRIVNLLLLILFLVGAALYARAWIGMQELTSHQPTPTDAPFAAMAQFHDLWQLSITGIWVIGAAVIGSVAVAIVAVVRGRD